MNWTITSALGATAGLLFAGAVLAQASMHEDREKLMKGMAAQLGALGGMAQEKVPYDAEKAKAAATELAALAATDFAPLFPEGDTEGDGNRATAKIWENMDDFMAKHQALVDATAALVDTAGVDLASLKAGFGPVGGACGACHKEYRAPE